jgi:hypothetical protein
MTRRIAFGVVLVLSGHAAALTLPDVSIALGGSYPPHLEVTSLTVKTKPSTPIEASRVKASYSYSQRSSQPA